MNSKPYLVTAGIACLLTVGSTSWANDSDRTSATPLLQLAAGSADKPQSDQSQPGKKGEKADGSGMSHDGADTGKQNGSDMNQDKTAKDKKAKKSKHKSKPEKQQQEMPSDTGAPSGGANKPAQ